MSRSRARLAPLIGAVAALPAVIACGRSEGEPSEGRRVGEIVDADVTPGDRAGRAAAAGSGLQELLGTVQLAEPVGTFTPCGGGAELRLVDRTDGKLREIYETLAGGAVLVDALGRRVEAVPGGQPGEAVEIAVLRRVAPEGEGPQCRPGPAGMRLLARGNEPFWAVDLLADEILFRDPENLEGIAFPGVERGLEGERRVWRSRRAGGAPREIVVAVAGRECRDSMSGAWFHLTATVEIGGRVLEGCAAATGPPEAPRA